MRTEVHVHGPVVLVEGVSVGQVEGARAHAAARHA